MTVNVILTKKILQSPQITSKKISLSDIYKLPILEKDFHTLKLNSPIKKTLGNQINNNNNSSKGKKTLNPNLYSFTSEKIKEIKEMKDRVSSRGLIIWKMEMEKSRIINL